MDHSLRRDERGAFRVERPVAWLLVILAIGFAVAIATGPGTTLATNAPDASFEGTFDSETNILRVEHAGGDAIRRGSTSTIVVTIADGQTGSRATVTWVADGDGGGATFPITSGDAITVDDPRIDSDGDGTVFDAHATVGFGLDEGDQVRVVWRGRPPGAPSSLNRTLASFPIGESPS